MKKANTTEIRRGDLCINVNGLVEAEPLKKTCRLCADSVHHSECVYCEKCHNIVQNETGLSGHEPLEKAASIILGKIPRKLTAEECQKMVDELESEKKPLEKVEEVKWKMELMRLWPDEVEIDKRVFPAIQAILDQSYSAGRRAGLESALHAVDKINGLEQNFHMHYHSGYELFRDKIYRKLQQLIKQDGTLEN